MNELIGKKITNIYLNDRYLRFKTSDGLSFTYEVEGDCCSHSYFYDFYGVKKLLENGEIISCKELDLSENSKSDDNGDGDGDYIQYYGYELVTQSKEFGEMTSVLSFRNASNGYYGGSMELTTDREVDPEIFDDVIEVKQK